MKKITDEDMKNFSSNYPNLAAILPDFMQGETRIYYDERSFESAERQLLDCRACKKGEQCLQNVYGYNTKAKVPKNRAGEAPSGLDENGNIAYGICDKWQECERRLDLSRIGIPPLFHNCTFDNFKPPNDNARKVLNACQKFASDLIDGKDVKGIFLSGPFGTGKTHLAAATMIRLYAHNIKGHFAVVPKLLALTRKSFHGESEERHDYIGEAVQAPVLVLDDIGAEKISEWVREQLFLLINERYENELPTIITTNASMVELEQRIGGASVSRIWGMCRGYVLDGPDYRRKR